MLQHNYFAHKYDMDAVKDFYSKIKFPGLYTIDNLKFYDEILINPFLEQFDQAVKDCKTILDVGCGTGFIINFLARRHPDKKFTAIDFSNSIDYAKDFSIQNNISNIEFYKEDFLTWNSPQQYDLVICNGVLHHIPKYELALKKIQELSNEKVVIGLYNPYGKIIKKFVPIKYVSETLYLDQEHCPFELTFNNNQVEEMFKEYKLLNVYPSIMNNFVDIINLFNSKNGGLTVYTWIKN